MNYFIFDVRSMKLHSEATTVGIMICNDTGEVIDSYYFDINVKTNFTNVFKKYYDSSIFVTDRPYPMKTNFLNLLIDEGYIPNYPYFILDVSSILYERKIFNRTTLPLESVIDEVGRMRKFFFAKEKEGASND